MAYGIKYQLIVSFWLLNSSFLANESQPSTFKFTVRPSLKDFIVFQPRTTERHCIFQHIIKLLLATRPDIWQWPCAYKYFHVKALWETPERRAGPWTCLSTHSSVCPCSGIPMTLSAEDTHSPHTLLLLFFHSKVLSTEPTEGSKLSGFRSQSRRFSQTIQINKPKLSLFALVLSSHTLSRIFHLVSGVGQPLNSRSSSLTELVADRQPRIIHLL